jgi:ATP-binding cassette subfamily D (ALD) protein 4
VNGLINLLGNNLTARFVVFVVLFYPFSPVRPYLSGDNTPDDVALLNSRIGSINLLVRVFGCLPYLSGRATDLSAAIDRVAELVEVFQDLTLAKMQVQSVSSGRVRDSVDCVAFEDVCVPFPNQLVAAGEHPRLIFNRLTFKLNLGESTVIMGPSGAGKSSLLRVIGGLWDVLSGTILRPARLGPGGLLFLPQKPYTTRGTLRDQVVYPLIGGEAFTADDALLQLMDFVGLAELVEVYGLHSQHDWPSVLSVGETQRLGFARLFFHRPAFALLDEATSALDEAAEAKLLTECVRSGVTMVSVAHRPAVMDFHEQVLELDGKGSFSLRPLARPSTFTGV